MKSRRVLLGLFVGLFALVAGTTKAQDSKELIEIGPDNIGGRVTSLVVDQRDATHNTIFAGTSTGGLYVRSNNSDYAEYADLWNYVRCVLDGKERVLPISHMVQLPDNTLVIATGEGCLDKGTKFKSMAAKGIGIVLYNPDKNEFTRLAKTDPAKDTVWTNINKLGFAVADGVTYVYAATLGGAYRWAISQSSDWEKAPQQIVANEEIFDVAVVRAHNMVYFAGKNSLHRLSDYKGDNVLNVTASDTNFAKASRIRLATSELDADYLYAMLTNSRGTLMTILHTTNQTHWETITTSTMTPFVSGAAATCGALCVDADNSSHLYVGGSSLWSGQGYRGNNIFQWTRSSYNEVDFGTSNFMDNVFTNSMYVHSGVNCIVQTTVTDTLGESKKVFYIATNAGVFEADESFSTFANINRGLNNVQVNGVAVCTDGSLLLGADYNANLFIQSRSDHDLSGTASGEGVRIKSWYDPDGSGTNHLANVYWQGNGGQVAASRFQQYAPDTRRTLFFSAENGLYARSYKDYNDYSNTQTWTIGDAFLSNENNSGMRVAQMHLWETTNAKNVSDVSYKLDTNDVIIRNGETLRVGFVGSNVEGSANGHLRAGDIVTIPNIATAYYPIRAKLTEDFDFDRSDKRIEIDNPIQSHLFVLTSNVGAASSGIVKTEQRVSMTWMPSDFTHTFNADASTGRDTMPSTMGWADIYALNTLAYSGVELTTFGVSADNNQILVVVASIKGDSCFIVRVKGIMDSVDYHKKISEIALQLGYGDGSKVMGPTLVADTLVRENGSIWFPRKISSIVCDAKDRAIITFEGHNNDFANVLLLNNASRANYYFTDKSINGKMAAYSALVEKTKGDVFIGTEDGLFMASKDSFNGNPTWNEYGNFAGVPITALTQQTDSMHLQRVTLTEGINVNKYIFPRTKYPFAIYIGTYGRGVFMDPTYIPPAWSDNEILDEEDYVGISPVVNGNGLNNISIYPNPASVRASMEMTIAKGGNAVLRIYDISGKMVVNKSLGHIAEGTYTQQIDCSSLMKGMYLVNLTVGGESAATKFIVR
ncbi:MAG: T9SS type A sorting domain-containing protein [Bacteroidales bacterium]|nr:T9SS type A sorting domain-containing protein [Bacteroidales bacterium]